MEVGNIENAADDEGESQVWDDIGGEKSNDPPSDLGSSAQLNKLCWVIY
jgi:hypothetical protein